MADPKLAALAAAWAVDQAGAQAWNGLCELFVEQAYGTSGVFPSAKDAIGALKPRRSMEQAKPGDIVLFAADPSNGFHGHAGLYLGNGRMQSATPAGVKETGILDDPYYAKLFVGIAEAPPEWKGQASTDKLEAGAQRILTAAGTAKGATNVADNELVTTYTEQRDEIKARLDENRAKLEAAQLLDDWAGDPTPTPQWLKRKGITQAQLDQAFTLLNTTPEAVTKLTASPVRPTALQTQITKDTTALQTAEQKLATAKTNAAKPPPAGAADPKGTKRTQLHAFPDGNQYVVTEVADGAGNWLTDTSAPPQPYGPQKAAPTAPTERPQAFQGADGFQYVINPDGKSVTKLAGQAEPAAKQKTFQIHELPNGEQWTWDATTGTLGTKIADAKPAEPPKRQSQMVNGRQVPIDPTSGIADPSRAVDLLTPEERAAEQRKLQPPGMPALADPFANLKQEQARRQQLAQAERDRLLGLQSSGVLTPDQAAQQFESYWQREVDAPLAGLRTLAEQAQAAARAQNEALQRTENQRAEGINRQREQYGYEAGEKARTTAAGLIPGVRSAAFLDKYAQSINAFSGNSAAPTWSAEDFRPDASQIPDLDAIAAQETARALAHISPAAAARVGAPIPDLSTMPDLNSFLPAFRLPAAAPVG